MPRGDGTGPGGMGPMTGRAAGYCAGYNVPGYMNPYGGRYPGAGRGFFGGFGRGRRNRYYAAGQPGWAGYNMGLPAWGGAAGYPEYGAPGYGQEVSPEQEVDLLKGQADFLKQQLDDIQARMGDLEKEKKQASDKKSK